MTIQTLVTTLLANWINYSISHTIATTLLTEAETIDSIIFLQGLEAKREISYVNIITAIYTGLEFGFLYTLPNWLCLFVYICSWPEEMDSATIAGQLHFMVVTIITWADWIA